MLAMIAATTAQKTDLMPLWITLAGGGLFSSLLGFFKFFLPWLEKAIDRKNERTIISSRRKIAAIYNILGRLERTGLGKRACVFVGHNCGGLPVVGKPFFVSSLYYNDSREGQKIISLGDYTNIRVDQEYNNMLLNIYDKGEVLIDVEDMAPCQLKSYYTAENIHQSYIVFLKIKNKEVYYVSCARYLSEDEFSDDDLTEIRLFCQQIATNI